MGQKINRTIPSSVVFLRFVISYYTVVKVSKPHSTCYTERVKTQIGEGKCHYHYGDGKDGEGNISQGKKTWASSTVYTLFLLRN
jgi:hypothetical protein